MHIDHGSIAVAIMLAVGGCGDKQPDASPVGTWVAEFWLDSVPPYDTPPLTRQVAGTITIGDSGRNSVLAWPDTLTHVNAWLGNYKINFEPFLGGPASDVSRTIFGRTTGTFATELEATVNTPDSLRLSMIPSIDHGGVEATGLINGDTVAGTWYVRAYAGGAVGHFRMTRTSRASPRVLRDLPPPSPDTLPLAARGTIRVRVLDTVTHKYITMRHGLRTDSSFIFSYSTGTMPEGWGPSFWLRPGAYGILLNEIPCGNETHFLDKDFEQRFKAVAGETTSVTVHVSLGALVLAQSYKNPKREPCAARLAR